MTARKLAFGLFATLLIGISHADDGKTIYQDNCQKCHGENGNAQTTRGYLYFARNFTSASWQAKRSDDDIYNIISQGPGWWSVMPAFKNRLSEDERRALVKIVRGFSQTPAH